MSKSTRRQVLAALIAAAASLAGCTKSDKGSGAAAPVSEASKGQDPVLATLGAAQKAEHALLLSFETYATATQRDDPSFSVLYRALARSCEVRLEALTEAIVARGGAVPESPASASASTLAGDLQKAIADVGDLSSNLYPELRSNAVKAKDTAAVQVLAYGVQVLPEMESLLQAGAEGLASGAPPSAQTYYVCPTCGHVTTTLDFDECPYCYTMARDFEAIS